MEENIRLDNVKQVLDEYAEKFKTVIKKQIVDNDNVATGELLESIETSVEVNGELFKVILHSKDYLKYLETGTRPHWPPTQPILEWVRAKKLPTKELTGNKKLPGEKSLTYLVRRKISEKGTEAMKNIELTQQQLNEIYMEKLKSALIKDLTAWMPRITIQIKFR